jgi:hypothetical protein
VKEAGGALLGLGIAGGYVLRDALKSVCGGQMMGSGMMGSATQADMSSYMKLFDRHTELRRTVEAIDGGARTTTESDAPDLIALLQAHVSSMYMHLNQHAEVTSMSSSLPTVSWGTLCAAPNSAPFMQRVPESARTR